MEHDSGGTIYCSRRRSRNGRGSGCRVSMSTRTPWAGPEPNAVGHRYRHGMFLARPVRCDSCRHRAECRANGKDEPRGLRVRDTDGRIPAAWFGESVWRLALKKADLMSRCASTTSAMPALPGSSPVALTSRSSDNATAASAPPRSPPRHRRDRPRRLVQDAEPRVCSLGSDAR